MTQFRRDNPPGKTDEFSNKSQIIFWHGGYKNIWHANENYPPGATPSFRVNLARIEKSVHECFDLIENAEQKK